MITDRNTVKYEVDIEIDDVHKPFMHRLYEYRFRSPEDTLITPRLVKECGKYEMKVYLNLNGFRVDLNDMIVKNKIRAKSVGDRTRSYMVVKE